MKLSRRFAAHLSGALCLTFATADAAVFKCVDASGRVTYQDSQCEARAAQSTVKVEAQAPVNARRPQPNVAAPKAASAKPAPRQLSPEEAARAEASARGVRETWQRLGQALNRGDTKAALQELTPGAQERFRPVFDTVVKEGKPFKFDQLGTIQSVAVLGDVLATITLTRKQADGTYAYDVMLMKGRDGKWLIDGM